MITPSGRRMGRRPDTSDDRDRHFLAAHPEAARAPLPPSVDLRRLLPPCFDQGDFSSCGPNMGAALMSFFYPEVAAFSRMQIYRDVRVLEKTGSEDDGVETRDVFRTLAETGAAPESIWPYDKANFAPAPPPAVYQAASKYRLTGGYSRLTSGSNYLQCLATGFPFGLGITLHESFDDETARTGIMRVPQRGDKEIGGHDVLCVGYILNFKSDPLFKQSGVDPALVADEALIIRNSWGTSWSRRYRGHFFMPLPMALDSVEGDDAWTGRK